MKRSSRIHCLAPRSTFITMLGVFVVLALGTPALADKPCMAESEAAKAAGSDPSLAYPTEKEAADHMAAANRAFGVQEYDKAIEEYTAAGLATSAPLVLYNLGQVYRTAKQYEKAIRQYELFLGRGNPGPEIRALVQCHIDTMKAELDSAASTAPPSGPAGEEQDGEPLPPPSHSRWTGKRKAAIGVGAAGLVAVGAGIAFGVRSRGFKNDAADICPEVMCARADEANDLVDKAKSNATYANIGFAVGAAAVIGAAVLWFTGAPSHAETPTAIVPHGSGVDLIVHF